MRKIAVVGSRSLSGRAVFDKIFEYVKGCGTPLHDIMIVSGGAQGVDTEAEHVAKDLCLSLLVFRPDWSIGKGAGFLRNTHIVENSDEVLAIWDGKSKGTMDTVNKAQKAGKKVHSIMVLGEIQ